MGTRFALVFILFAAAGIGYFLWSSSGSDRESATSALPQAAAVAEPRADSAALTSAQSLPDATRSEREVRSVPQAEVAKPAVASETVEGPALTGRVVDGLGNGLAGASVTLSDRRSGFFTLGHAELPRPGLYVTESDAEGRFGFDRVPAGTLQVSVSLSGYAPFERADLVVPRGEAHELEPFVLALGALLRGRVVDAAGGGVPGAALRMGSLSQSFDFGFARRSSEPFAVTEDDGSFLIDRLACGPWEIVVDSARHPKKSFRGMAETPGAETSGLVFQLERGDVISGRVVGFPEEERGELEVRARRATDEGFRGFADDRTAVVEHDGTFLLEGLHAEQDYLLQARRQSGTGGMFPGMGSSRSEPLSAHAGTHGVEIPYLPEATVSFQVLDARTRQPLTAFRVEAGVTWPRPLLGPDRKPLLEHENGLVVVDGLRPGADERAQIRVTATGYREYARDDIAVATGTETNLGKVFLEPVPVVRVTVLDQKTGAPIEGARVRLQKEAPSNGNVEVSMSFDIGDSGGDFLPGGAETARTDENGVAELTSLEGENVSIQVSKTKYAKLTRSGVFLPAGETVEETVRLSRGGAIEVTVLDPDGLPVPGARVAHRTPEELRSNRRSMVFGGPMGGRDLTDAGGKILFDNLTLGTHSFRVDEGGGGPAVMFAGGETRVELNGGLSEAAPDESWTEVEVVEGETGAVTVRAKARAALTGIVREAGRPLVGATVKLAKKSDASNPMAMMMPGMMGGGDSALTDGAGRYVLDGLTEDDYTLSIDHPTRRMTDKFDVEVEAGDNTFDANLAVSVLEGRVTDTAGEPVSGLRVSVEVVADRGGPRRMMQFVMITDDGDETAVSSGDPNLAQTVYTDGDGRYRLRGVTPDKDLVVKVEGGDLQPAKSAVVRVAPDEVLEDVDVTVEPGGSLTVNVLASDGTPAQLCMVRARHEEEGVDPEQSFAQSGRATLKGLKPGRWTVTVESIGPGGGDQPSAERDVLIDPGGKHEESMTLE